MNRQTIRGAFERRLPMAPLGSVGLRRDLGSVFMADSAGRYWRVRVRVSKRRGRYIKLQQQGHISHLPLHDVRASADDYVGRFSGRPYRRITSDEWAAFETLAHRFRGRAVDERDADVIRARATLDRVIEEAPSRQQP